MTGELPQNVRIGWAEVQVIVLSLRPTWQILLDNAFVFEKTAWSKGRNRLYVRAGSLPRSLCCHPDYAHVATWFL